MTNAKNPSPQARSIAALQTLDETISGPSPIPADCVSFIKSTLPVGKGTDIFGLSSIGEQPTTSLSTIEETRLEAVSDRIGHVHLPKSRGLQSSSTSQIIDDEKDLGTVLSALSSTRLSQVAAEPAHPQDAASTESRRSFACRLRSESLHISRESDTYPKEVGIEAAASPQTNMTLPEMSRRQKNLAAAIREHLVGHDLNETFSVFLHILSQELRHLAETEPHIAQRNAHRFGKLLTACVSGDPSPQPNSERDAECFTVVFQGNVRKLQGNPHKYETQFGPVLSIGMGNAFDPASETLASVDEVALQAALDYSTSIMADIDTAEMREVIRIYLGAAAAAPQPDLASAFKAGFELSDKVAWPSGWEEAYSKWNGKTSPFVQKEGRS